MPRSAWVSFLRVQLLHQLPLRASFIYWQKWLLGTVIGLIEALHALQDPKGIGAAVSTLVGRQTSCEVDRSFVATNLVSLLDFGAQLIQ